MGFQADHAVNHLSTNRFEHLGPVDIRLFVKTRLQLHHHGDFLAAAHGFAQQQHEFRVSPGTVNGLLDGQHLRVVHRLAQKGQHTIKALKWLMNGYIAVLEAIKKRLPMSHMLELGGVTGAINRKQ